MTRPAPEKIIYLQSVPDCVAAALAPHLAACPNLVVTRDPGPLPDIIVAGSAADVTALAAPILRLTSPDRLGALLADIGRALDEPALAVAPFLIGHNLFDPAAKTLSRAGRTDITLTERETALLLHLARHAPRAVSRDDILRAVWDYAEGIDTHTLETHIYRLRQKIVGDGDAALLKTTEDGYVLEQVAPQADAK